MDDTEDDARYPLKAYGENDQQASGSAQQRNQYADDDSDEDDNDEVSEEDSEEEEDGTDVSEGLRKYDEDDSDPVVVVDDDDNGNHNDEGDEDDEENKIYYRGIDGGELVRHPKKRKLKNLISNYEFAPRVAASSTAVTSAPKSGRRNSLMDWTENETFVLLNAWGDKFVQLGRKSIRSEEWHKVSEKVSQESKTRRTDTQCRNRLDTLKKKYKKEKMKSGGGSSKWVYFKMMDMLMSSSSRQAALSGEYVSMNPKVCLNRANGMDDMRDSCATSDSTFEKEDDSGGIPTKRPRFGQDSKDGSSFRLLADSIQKFIEIYEKIENNKRLQMAELEKMRMDFCRELESQKREILEKAQAEVAKIHGGDDEEDDPSAENVRR